MLGSLGLLELLVIVAIILLLFGGNWLSRFGQVAGQSAKKKVLGIKSAWTATTGTEEDALRAEWNFGQTVAEEVSREYKGSDDEAKQATVLRLGTQLRAARKVQNTHQFTYKVIAKPVVNACALPGGFIFLNEPLFDMFDGDNDAVAFILAHEMAHVVLGHARERWLRESFMRGVTARASGVVELAGTVLVQGYSQGDELEADTYAASLLADAGFDPRGAARVLAMFNRMAGDEPAFLEYLSSHPPVQKRIKNLHGDW